MKKTNSRAAPGWKEECLVLFQADFDMLRDAFELPESAATVTKVTGGLSDPHCGGKTVVRFDLASGHFVFLKMRSLSTDILLRTVLGVINRVHPVHIVAPPVVDRVTYGWSLGLSARPPSNDTEELAHFEALGHLLAFGYYLGASDLHAENLVPIRDRVALVDVETIFNPTIPDNPTFSEPVRRAASIINDSVLRTGLLPRATTLRPTLPDKTWDEPRVESLIRGFSSMFRNVAGMSAEAAYAALSFEGLVGARSRVIFRDTAAYVSACEIQADEFGQSDQEIFIRKRLADEIWCRLPSVAINHEVKALMRGDIPIFSSSITQGDLSCDGRLLVEHFFRENGLAGFLRRIKDAGSEVLEMQVRLIRARLLYGSI